MADKLKRKKDPSSGALDDLALVAAGWRRARSVPLDDVHLARDLGYDEENDAVDAVRIVRSHTIVSFERLVTLWQQVRYLDRYAIPGSLVECGTRKGGCVALMALAHLRSGPARRMLHLFDSFEGLPEPLEAVDGPFAVEFARGRATGKLRSIEEGVSSLEENRELLEGRVGYPPGLIAYHAGWFQETIPPVAGAIGDIALLRLDGDWYESTKVCIEHLYPRVVPGGVVVIDDYGHWEGCHRAVDEFIGSQSEPILLHHIDYSGRYWLRGTPHAP